MMNVTDILYFDGDSLTTRQILTVLPACPLTSLSSVKEVAAEFQRFLLH